MAIPGISTNDRERFVVRADEKLTVFAELESAIRAGQRLASSNWLDDSVLWRGRQPKTRKR